MKNALTVDVEDWQQSSFDSSLPISECAYYNTVRLLGILSEHRIRATFFIQTMVAEAFPGLIACIAAEGHEIACHGHCHVPIFKLTPLSFAEDLRRSLGVLSKFVHQRVQGYRAPDFSIRHDTLWSLEILRDHGFSYSSSIFPIRGRRYGIPDISVRPHEILHGLFEVPLPVARFLGHNWPVAGGGYLRLYPYSLTRLAIKSINAEGRPAVVYLHPYELDDEDMKRFRGRVSVKYYWSQKLNRHKTEAKLRRLLEDFEFAPVCEVIQA